MTKPVEYHKLNYKDFGYLNSEGYNQLYLMVKDYGFWFSGFIAVTKADDMTEFVQKKAEKHKHKFILYRKKDTDTYYLVQYCKNVIRIYYCYDGKYATIKKNMYKAYKKGMEDRDKETASNV